MRKTFLGLTLLVLSLFIAVGSSMAATYGTIPGGAENDLLGDGNSASGWYGLDLYSGADQDLTFTYLGSEAGWTNTFEVYDDGAWTNLFTTNSTTLGAEYSLSVTNGELIQFRFLTSGGGDEDSVTNGSNPDDSDGSAGMNFFTSFGAYAIMDTPDSSPDYSLTADMVGLWLDDSGASDDDNHDDMLIGVSGKIINPVPIPSTIGLLSLGLLGLAGVNRKKK